MGAFFLQRINDHLQYLRKIDATLSGRGDFRGGDHHACKLGQWIDSVGPREAAAFGPAAVAALEGVHHPHELFHAASGRALALKESGEHEACEREVTLMHQLSRELVDLLLGLDQIAQSGKA